MRPVSPVIPGTKLDELKIAEHQPEYNTLPALPIGGGAFLARWEFEADEAARISQSRICVLAQETHGRERHAALVLP